MDLPKGAPVDMTPRARLQELGLDALREMAGSIDVKHDGLQKTKLISAIIGSEKFDEKMLPELPPEPEVAADRHHCR